MFAQITLVKVLFKVTKVCPDKRAFLTVGVGAGGLY